MIRAITKFSTMDMNNYAAKNSPDINREMLQPKHSTPAMGQLYFIPGAAAAATYNQRQMIGARLPVPSCTMQERKNLESLRAAKSTDFTYLL